MLPAIFRVRDLRLSKLTFQMGLLDLGSTRHPEGTRRRTTNLCLGLLIFILGFVPSAGAAQPILYQLDLRSPETHLVKIAMTIPDAGANTQIQIPTWNCLYQIRDFVKDVRDLRGECDGEPADLTRVDLNTWQGPNHSCRTLIFNYSAYVDVDGPFDSILDSSRSFLNLAMILFYLPNERARPVETKYKLPGGWGLATLLEGDGGEFRAANYDALVDSPVEAGHFAEFSYPKNFTPAGGPPSETKHATVRVIIDADPSDYSSDAILNSLKQITAEETTLMQDQPFTHYTFILHFPRDEGGTGGMEHSYGTAIAVRASSMRQNERILDNVAAHEFFHLWNVKRIRPQGLEPIDYIHGNDTRDLWLAEGVTNTYAELTLLRAGLTDRDGFYRRVARAIQFLQNRPAHSLQSVETSGREAWLEKYTDYNSPERSISYYNKGEIVGYLLDLGMRHASQNRAGLDDLMRRLNQDFAQRGRFYTLADLQTIVAQLAPGFDAGRFFHDYVQGTAELDYSTYFRYAGLQFTLQKEDRADSGFSVARNSDGQAEVDSVDTDSNAERAGLQSGDIVMLVDGQPLPAGTRATLPHWQPGQTVELQISRAGVAQTLKFQIGSRQQITAQLQEDPQATAGQLRVREGWLTGATQAAPGNP